MMLTNIEVLGIEELSMGMVSLNIRMDQSTLEDSHRGLKHGQGHYISSSGYEYDGEWLSGKQTGKAFIKYKNGDVYDGHVLRWA